MEWEAATSANLNLFDWERGIYPNKFKARVLAWYKYSNLVKIHGEDAVNKPSEREKKKNQRKR